MNNFWFILGCKLLHAYFSGYELEVDFDPKELEEVLLEIYKSDIQVYREILRSENYNVIVDRWEYFLNNAN